MAVQTLTQMRVRLRKMLGLNNVDDVDDNGLTKDDATDALNNELMRWLSEANLTDHSHATQEVTMTYTAGQAAVALPTGAKYRPVVALFYVPTGGTDPDDRIELQGVGEPDLDGWTRVDTAFSVRAATAQISIRPVPTQDMSLVLLVDKAPTLLSSPNDEPSVVPIERRIGLVHGAAAELLADRGDVDKSVFRKAAADDHLLRFKMALAQTNPRPGFSWTRARKGN